MQQLLSLINDKLDILSFDDYCKNGVQIEGDRSKELKVMAFAVSATENTILEAIKQKAQVLLVHHGLFWKGDRLEALEGANTKRLYPLIKAGLELWAYHLPLDGHLELGHAARLAFELGLCEITSLQSGIKGKWSHPQTVEDIVKKVELILKKSVIVSSKNRQALISSVGIITGRATREWKMAKDQGCELYITGEMGYSDWEEALEQNVPIIAGGHNATEELGIFALMNFINKVRPEIKTFFIKSENPV